uniref:Uncharacterized protein n=1 Tax=Angiostrongylus cantonensis TaxID=6313 RepID=A0A0K0D7Q4_ANGCA
MKLYGVHYVFTFHVCMRFKKKISSRNEVLLAVAPLAFCYGGNECNCQPSTSRDIRIRKVSIKPLDGYKLSPNTLYALSTDIDSNSIGFVDVEELRALEGEV